MILYVVGGLVISWLQGSCNSFSNTDAFCAMPVRFECYINTNIFMKKNIF